MNQTIMNVNQECRPKENFVCADCPFANWTSGTVEYGNGFDVAEIIRAENDDFLDCYCFKTHSYTFDSTIKTTQKLSSNVDRRIFVYKNKTTCEVRTNAINQILSGEQNG